MAEGKISRFSETENKSEKEYTKNKTENIDIVNIETYMDKLYELIETTKELNKQMKNNKLSLKVEKDAKFILGFPLLSLSFISLSNEIVNTITKNTLNKMEY